MAIPKKQRRTIVVDCTEYHYRIRLHEAGRGVVQHGSGHGSCLFVFPHAILEPRHVAYPIRFGIEQGWKSGEVGKELWVAFDRDSDNNSMLEYVPSDDMRVVNYNAYGRL